MTRIDWFIFSKVKCALNKYQTELDGIVGAVADLLAAGLNNARHGFRMPVLASIGRDGRAVARALILRHVDFAAREIRLHTDRRTQKVDEIAARPDVILVFNDRDANVQVQLKGRATLHHDDAYADAAWAAASPSSRRAYLAELGPGSPLTHPSSGLPADVRDIVPDEARLRPGRQNFSAIRIIFDQIDWLLLDGAENRRAAFTFDAGKWNGVWQVP